MRITWLSIVVLWSMPLWGQSGAQLKMDLDDLEKKADEVVSVNLEGELLEGGRKLLNLHKEITEPVKKLVSGIKGIYLRRFFFGKKKAYSEKDVEALHKQMKGPGWMPMIAVKDRNKPEAVTVYSYTENEELAGVTVLSEEEQEVTVVNIVGPVDLETLSLLGAGMGIPSMHVATSETPGKETASDSSETQPAIPSK